MKILNSVKIKYAIDAYKLLPSYPTKEDIEFDLLSFSINSSLKKKDFSTSNLKVYLDDFSKIFGEKTLDLQFKDKIKSYLRELISENRVKIIEGGFQITEDTFNQYYSMN